MPHQCTNCGHTFADGSKEMLSGCPECGGNKFQFLPSDDVDVDALPDATPPERPESEGVSGAVGKAAATVRDLVRDDPARPDSTVGPEGADDDSVTFGDGTSAEGTADDSVATADAASSDGPRDDGVRDDEGRDDGVRDDDGRVDDGRVDEVRDDDVIEAGATEGDANTGDATAGDATAEDATAGDATAEDATAGDATAEDAAQASARTEMVSSDDLPEPPAEGRVLKEPDADAEPPDMEALREELNDQFESIRVVAPGQYELNLMELYDREEYIIALRENGRYVIEVPDAVTESTERREGE